MAYFQPYNELYILQRLVTNLPPWLLVSNSEWERLNDERTKKLSCFLNDNLVRSLNHILYNDPLQLYQFRLQDVSFSFVETMFVSRISDSSF